jgi:branched-chain amino acid transport system substrate-binding protein
VRAIEAAKSTDGAKVTEALRSKVKDFPGLTGKISFDDKGDRVGEVHRVYRVDASGAFVLRR